MKDLLYEAPGPHARAAIRVATAVSVVALAALAAYVAYAFYVTGQLDAQYWSLFGQATTWTFLAHGLLGTVEVALASGTIAFVLGMVLMIARRSRYRVCRWVAIALIEFTRGVPTLLLIYFFFLAAPQFGLTLPAFWKIVLPVALSACGVVAEVLRSGINAVPRGQTEAALALGMRDFTAFRKIVLPQALRYIVPTLIAELVIVLKDTTFAYVVNYNDLMQNSRVLVSNHNALLSVYLVTAIIYILINYVLHKIAVAISHRSEVSIAAMKWN